MLTATNRARAASGLAPLTISPALMTAAQSWATSMARAGRLSHEGMAHRIWDAVGMVAGAENVAAGQADVSAVMVSWLSSPGHRANILGGYNRVGWGVAQGDDGKYWCQMFAKV